MNELRQITFTDAFDNTQIVLVEVTPNDKIVLEQLKAMQDNSKLIESHWKIHKDSYDKFFTQDEITLLSHMYVFAEKVEGLDATGRKVFLVDECAALHDVIQSAMMDGNEKMLNVAVSAFNKCFPYIKIAM